MKIDGTDLGLLLDMYHWAPTMTELGDNNKKRVYRLSRANLCMCDMPGMHPGEPRCWSLTPKGENLVELIDDTEIWQRRRWEYEVPK